MSTPMSEWRRVFAKWRNRDHMQLHAGEMSAQERRSVVAVLTAVEYEVATALSSQAAEIAELRAELEETFTDEKGNVWHRPTAWAYYAACRALDAAQAALTRKEG